MDLQCTFQADILSVAECLILSHPSIIPGLLTTSIALIASVIAALSLRANYVLARSKNALDFEKALEDSNTYTEYNKQLSSFQNQTLNDSSALVELAKNPNLDLKAYYAAIELLNWWERCANGIRCKVYRDDVLRKVYCSHFLHLSSYLKPFILQRRIERKNSAIFSEFLWLSKRWQRKSYARKQRLKKKSIVVFITAVLTCLTAVLLSPNQTNHSQPHQLLIPF